MSRDRTAGTCRFVTRYATLHDTTVRHAFGEYCRQRVNLAGDRIAYDPAAPTADAECTKHNMARVDASLPNGYCGRPPQQDCPHPNACLACPTSRPPRCSSTFTAANETRPASLSPPPKPTAGSGSLVNHRLVHDNLDRLINTLEAIGDTS